jgi:glucose-1-phosphate adenylyltransferase
MAEPRILGIVLAGGAGTRLAPLTEDRAKPAVPFGGIYRIVDFTLSNCLNSGLRQILVLTQYKARSLDRHILAAWGFLSRELGEYIEVLPPQQRIDEHWYQGTADAVRQQIRYVAEDNCDHVLILSGDQLYQMDYREMVEQHKKNKAELTVATIPVTAEEAPEFGIMKTN